MATQGEEVIAEKESANILIFKLQSLLIQLHLMNLHLFLELAQLHFKIHNELFLWTGSMKSFSLRLEYLNFF